MSFVWLPTRPNTTFERNGSQKKSIIELAQTPYFQRKTRMVRLSNDATPPSVRCRLMNTTQRRQAPWCIALLLSLRL